MGSPLALDGRYDLAGASARTAELAQMGRDLLRCSLGMLVTKFTPIPAARGATSACGAWATGPRAAVDDSVGVRGMLDGRKRLERVACLTAAFHRPVA